MRIAVDFVVVLSLLVGASLVQAGQGKKSRPEGTRGVITSVDGTAKTFTFRTGKKKDPNAQEVAVQFGDNTKFTKLAETGPEAAKGDDLVATLRVAVVYETKDGKNLAAKVTILGQAKKKKS